MRRHWHFGVLFLAACAGHLTMQPVDEASWRRETPPRLMKGILVYPPRYMLVTYTFTSLVDGETGRFLGTAADKKCRGTIREELKVLPDFSRAYLLSMAGGFMNSNKLSVTLQDGVLTAVNAESTPQASELITSLATLLEKAAPLAGIAGTPTGKGPEAPCNSEPRITGLQRYQPSDGGPAK